MTTVVPTGPEVGLNEIIDGCGAVAFLLHEKEPMQNAAERIARMIFFAISVGVYN